MPPPPPPPFPPRSYATVDRLNADVLLPMLSNLTSQPFFRYFRVNLRSECPFWRENAMCFRRDCSVCECEESEVPLPTSQE